MAYGRGDSFLIENILETFTASECFEIIKNETNFGQFRLKGGMVSRLVSIQGHFSESTPNEQGVKVVEYPVYRHPVDNDECTPKLMPFTETIKEIKGKIEDRIYATLGRREDFNHCLIQYYRDDKDFIGEHADKTLDIVHNSLIVNFSLGCTRTLMLRPKRNDRNDHHDIQRVRLVHNSLFILGPESNKHFVHGIKANNRIDSMKQPDELLYNKQRISLTFRTIGTYKSDTIDINTNEIIHTKLVGQGAPTNNRTDKSDDNDIQRLYESFSIENRSSDYNWNDLYGKGFTYNL
jgi:alkylated DNA repair dioxygenase AlkB